MYKVIKNISLLLAAVIICHTSSGQGMQLGEAIIATTPELKPGKSVEDLRAFVLKDVSSASNNKNQAVSFHLFQADRGNLKGKYLLVCNVKKISDRKGSLSTGSPFSDKMLGSRNSKKASDVLANPGSFTEYHLLGANNFRSLPDVSILGIHYLKVRKDRAGDFEKLVLEKMHPAVGDLLPNMHLLTYKAVSGDQKGTYITIFAIRSLEARDEYWPAGKPETERLKAAFKPLQNLAGELKDYLEPGSYLEPSGGAAAIFESKEWTDFIHVQD